jgi:uncharacterized membrane protein
LAPLAAKGIGKLAKGNGAGALAEGPKKLAQSAGSKLGDSVGDKVTGKIDDAGGPSGILKDTVKSALPFGGGGGGKKNDATGVGKGRRMPVQQSVDVGLPVETVYNQWTQFEEWPKFMHRVTRVSQEDPCKVSFTVKIWGKSKEFTAEIQTQRPDDRIKWKTTEGMNLSGFVTFRELGPNLTRVLLSFDLDPGGLIEKYARGARFVKRAARADLHRFVAFIEMLENETGAWRGVIEDGEVVEDHDPKYDKQREYGSADELLGDSQDDEDDDDSDEDDEKQSRPRSASRSRSRKATGTGSGSRSRSKSSGSGRSSGSSSSRSRSSRSGSSSGNSGGRSGGRSSSRSRSSSNGTSSSSGRTTRASGGSSRSSRGSSSSSNGHQGRQRTQSSQRTRSSRRG